MSAEIRQKVMVQPGGVIQIHSAELPDGAMVEVIVLLDQSPPESSSLAA